MRIPGRLSQSLRQAVHFWLTAPRASIMRRCALRGELESRLGHAGRVVAVSVQSGDTGVLGRRRAHPIGIHEDAVAEESEPEIREPVGTDLQPSVARSRLNTQ